MRRLASAIFIPFALVLLVGWIALAATSLATESTDARFKTPYSACIVDPDSAAVGRIVTYAQAVAGMYKTVGIWINPATDPSDGYGGFEFLICYDQSLLNFIGAARGPNLDPIFEYFNYRTGEFGGSCAGECQEGYVKVVGVADLDNGITPAPGAFALGGVIALITFKVDSKMNNIGLCAHVGFCSFNCEDNSILSRTGDSLFVPLPDDQNISFGPGYTCAGYHVPGREVCPAINFCGSAICILGPWDDRGDINLNGIPNEIGDVILFGRYFLEGLSALESNANLRSVQTLESDVNNDGIALSVADLVYLVRIVTGDAPPFPPLGSGPKLSPWANSVTVNSDLNNGSLSIRTNAPVDLGGAVFVYHYSGLAIGSPALTAGTNLQVKSRAANGELRILVCGNASGARVPAGINNLITIPISGDGTMALVESQVSDAGGALLSVNVVANAAPATYNLSQNYPNPFNAGTMIQFSLTDQTNWDLSIYNIAGQVVRTFSGIGQGGVSVAWDGTSQSGASLATGMYFYRLFAKDFAAARKMVLIK